MPSFLQRYDFPIHLFILTGFVRHAVSLRWNTFRTKLWLRLAGCSYGPGFQACGRPILRVSRRGAIRFGANVMLQSRLESNMAGGTGPTTLLCYDGGRIEVGDHSGCSFTAISSRSSVVIGSYVSIGANVRIYDHDFHPVDPNIRRRTPMEQVATRPVRLGDDVFVGANSLILKGVTIGDRAVIGAGSVVTKSVPAGEIWAGNPAKRVRTLTCIEDGCQR